MKRFILAVCAGLLAAAMATPSGAADLRRPVYKGPAFVAPVFTWTGFYVGINGGYGFGNSNWDPGPNFDTNGWLVGGTIGYNLQTGNFVWGLEADLDYSNMKGDSGGVETRVSYFGTARGRIGYAFDRFMPYLTGGAAFAQIKMDAGAGDDKDNQIGWTIGGGVEWAFLANWSAKLEYLYADLGEAECGAGACGVATDVRFKTSIIRGGINYRF
jgi:outer membrane immunogenic protein